MITKKAKYAIKAMIYLSKKKKGEHALITDISDAEHIPKKFLEAILLDLRKAGYLGSKKGKGGGYALAKPPREIMMGQVIRILEGPLAPVSCVSESAYKPCDDCQDEESCGIRLVMKDVRDAIANVLDRKSLQDVINQKQHFLEKKSVIAST